jgi:hypothetical protein
MDRHIEFATQLSHLVALYAREPLDRAAEKATLRAARGAAKHGAVLLAIVDGVLRAGRQDAPSDVPDVDALRLLLKSLGVERIEVAHHARQEEVKRLARALAGVAAGRARPADLARELSAGDWSEITVSWPTGAAGVAGGALVAGPGTGGAAETAETAETTETAETAEAPTPEGAAGLPAAADDRAALAEREETGPAPAISEPAPEMPEGLEEAGRPLAERLPDDVERLAGPEYRELFARLITSSEPWTLRRLLEPVQSAIEQSARSGRVAASARLIVALFACEACAEDPEMRRQFVVMLRRLTKPTLIRAYAMLFGTAPDSRGELEQVLARFGEDGAEAVADCVGNATSREARALYVSLLARLPGTGDALVAMLDDEREVVAERAIALMTELRHPELERVLGDALGHEHSRVRQAAARALADIRDSAFAADALVRASQDVAPEVRLIAATGLQARREERIVPTLLPLIDTEEELDVQLALVAALGRIVTPDGVQKLIALANPTERQLRRRRAPVLRLSAIEALGEARTPAAMAALQKLLEDKDKEVRESAARLYTRARRQTAALGTPVVTDA